jgi:hypothetical protein
MAQVRRDGWLVAIQFRFKREHIVVVCSQQLSGLRSTVLSAVRGVLHWSHCPVGCWQSLSSYGFNSRVFGLRGSWRQTSAKSSKPWRHDRRGQQRDRGSVHLSIDDCTTTLLSSFSVPHKYVIQLFAWPVVSLPKNDLNRFRVEDL